ncbi:MAG: TlpA disulfide reductase family protein [Gemmatimonadales bacterium]|nr:TlpA disulfide reductase family protein [Gemmatimonadales bacterium]
MKKQWIIVLAVVGVLTAGAVMAVKLSPDIFPVEVGSRAPDFTAADLATGDTVTLASYRGQVVLLNVWATWCEPCRVEMPSMERLQQELGPQGLKIVAISIDEAGPDVVREFQRELGLTFQILHDRSRAIERIYQTTGVPESFVLNREGRIMKKVIGAVDWDSPVNKDLVRRLLAQRG